ncbi:MAG TPA: hypothetical protein VFH88_06345, partial [Candidatus Krumholzibacteria bacterium]|nr:hypothetical protein [Candidatus Krumholzibacteria bacterium]
MARISTRSRARRFAPLFLRLAPVIAAMSFLPALVSAAPAHVLLPVADVPLPGRATRFDYQSLDPLTGRLYIAHMGDGKLLVFDTHGRNVVASL